ncbi:MAG: recombinase family protein [Chthoniobacter sp.]|uniref:recombinase family protein n=1 Tax=Chthoniobacter sp. TaxID=2510640 RepID=UPI0032A88166
MEGKFIAYYRVSTVKQGQSGLGLEAQKAAVEKYLNGGHWTLSGEFVEVESGKRKNRPQLNAALALCKKQKATLIIAKLDRLARNLHFISGLMESRIEFLAVDNPTANRLTVQILAAVAEEEARAISARTKAALAAAKARGVVLGKHGSKLGKENHKRAIKIANALAGTIEELRAEGITSVRAIAAVLNTRGIATPQGKQWHSTSVQRLLKRMEQLA